MTSALQRHRALVYWTRPLADGRVQFYAAANGQTIQGSATADSHEFLIGAFERWAQCTLPIPERKRALFGQRGDTAERRKGSDD